MRPLISIVIPYYNRPQYVQRAVESVLRQSYTNWELILIDDCSVDKVNLEEIKQKNIRILHLTNQINVGPGLSRQTGVDNSSGEFICFLDSDDIYEPTFLQDLLYLHIKQPEIAGAYCITKSTNGDINRKSDIECKQLLPYLFTMNRPWETSSWLWRKTEIAAWKNLRTNEDWLFEIDTASKNNNIAHLNKILCIKDDDTGENTKDLVDAKSPELHRNYVANYALNSLSSFKLLTNYIYIKKSIVKRLIFTSSKLIGLNEYKITLLNGYRLLPFNPAISVLLIIFSLVCVVLPFTAPILKKTLHRINQLIN